MTLSQCQIRNVEKCSSRRLRKNRKMITMMMSLLIPTLTGEKKKETLLGSSTNFLINSGSESDTDECNVCGHEGELSKCVECNFQCHAECAKPPMKKARAKNWKCWKCICAQQRSERIKRRRMDKGLSS